MPATPASCIAPRALYALGFLIAAAASAPVWAQPYIGSGRVRYWGIPGGDNTIVGLFVLFFGLTLWCWCRAVWVSDARVKRNNFIFSAVSLVLTVALVVLYARTT